MAKKTSDGKTSPTSAESSTGDDMILHQGQIAEMGMPKYRGPQVKTTLPMDSMEQKKLVFNVLQGKLEPLSEQVGKPIAWVHYVAERGLITNPETGDTRMGVRVVVIDDEGNKFFTVAASIIAAIDRIVSFWGEGPYDPPLSFKLSEGKTGKGRNWYHLELL